MTVFSEEAASATVGASAGSYACYRMGQSRRYPEGDQPGDDQQPGARLLAGHIWHSEPPEPWVLSACPFPARLTPAGPRRSLASGEAGRRRVPARPQIGRGEARNGLEREARAL